MSEAKCRAQNDMMFYPTKNCMSTNVPHQERQEPNVSIMMFYRAEQNVAEPEINADAAPTKVIRRTQPKSRTYKANDKLRKCPCTTNPHAQKLPRASITKKEHTTMMEKPTARKGLY